MTIIPSRILKRKVEGPPVIETKLEIINPEPNPVEELHTLEQEPHAGSPIGGKHRGGPSDGHLAPVQAESRAGPVPDDNLLWALLTLIGYETW